MISPTNFARERVMRNTKMSNISEMNLNISMNTTMMQDYCHNTQSNVFLDVKLENDQKRTK